MPKIGDLIPDIEAVLRNQATSVNSDILTHLGTAVAMKTAAAVKSTHAPPKAGVIRMSELGTQCGRKLWYTRQPTSKPEELLPHTRVKFLYGDYIEEMMLALARIAGHKVEGEQTRLELPAKDGFTIVGHRDAIVDDVLIDVKSASTFAFDKFTSGLNDDNDAFGYRAQLQAYQLATDVQEGRKLPMGWLVVEKQNGKMLYAPHKASQHINLEAVVTNAVAALSSTKPPERAFDLLPDKTGLKLGVQCSYCPYKKECWPDLRAFSSYRGPVFYAKVHSEPRLKEIVL